MARLGRVDPQTWAHKAMKAVKTAPSLQMTPAQALAVKAARAVKMGLAVKAVLSVKAVPAELEPTEALVAKVVPGAQVALEVQVAPAVSRQACKPVNLFNRACSAIAEQPLVGHPIALANVAWSVAAQRSVMPPVRRRSSGVAKRASAPVWMSRCAAGKRA